MAQLSSTTQSPRSRRAEPKTLRWRLWHAPARLIRHARRDIVRILEGWPDATAITAAHQRIAALR